jgi:amidase
VAESNLVDAGDIPSLAERMTLARRDPEAFTELLERIREVAARWNERANAFEQINLLEPEGSGGALRGMTFVVKGNIGVADVPLRLGTPQLYDIPKRSAAIVRRLLDEGATLLGVATLDYLALGATGRLHDGREVLNPRHPERSILGSSSGCASIVAAGLADIGIGTDFGGSVRAPAAAAGIVGLKLTPNALERDGTIFIDDRLDCFGLLARDLPTLSMLSDTWGIERGSAGATPTLVVDPKSPLRDSHRLSAARTAFREPWNEEETGVVRKLVAAERAARYMDALRMSLTPEARALRDFGSDPTQEGSRRRANDRLHEMLAEARSALRPEEVFVGPALRAQPPLLRSGTDEEQISRLLPLFPANLFGLASIVLPPSTTGSNDTIQLSGWSEGVVLRAAGKLCP